MHLLDLHAVPKTVLAARGRAFGSTFRVIKGPKIYELNPTGVAIWKRCDGTKSVDVILTEIAAEFECSRQESDEPCLQFFQYLISNQLISLS